MDKVTRRSTLQAGAVDTAACGLQHTAGPVANYHRAALLLLTTPRPIGVCPTVTPFSYAPPFFAWSSCRTSKFPPPGHRGHSPVIGRPIPPSACVKVASTHYDAIAQSVVVTTRRPARPGEDLGGPRAPRAPKGRQTPPQLKHKSISTTTEASISLREGLEPVGAPPGSPRSL